MLRYLIYILLALSPILANANGNSARSLPGAICSNPPIIDGTGQEEEWKPADRAIQFIDAATSRPASDQTETRLMYDSEAIYVYFRCIDSRPSEIVSREIRYGASLGNEDSVTFEIDPFYSRNWSTVSSFTCNALGTQVDNFAGGKSAKREWRGAWQAAAHRTTYGWEAEVRIPWSILSFPPGKKLTMGINFRRRQQRTFTNSVWSDTTSARRAEFIGIWKSIDPPTLKQKHILQTLQYVTAEWCEEKPVSPIRAGMDIRYTPTPLLTGMVSVEPDFKGIEQAVEGINFTRSERYQGEARPFFQEGKSFYPGLFYSRRIENFDVGVKVFGNITPQFSLGLLSTERGAYDNASMVNLKYSMQEHGRFNIFGMLRRKPDTDHDATGFGLQLRSGMWRYDLGWANAREGKLNGDKGDVSLGYSIPHWYANAGWGCVSPGFSPSLGYIASTDKRTWYANTGADNEFRKGPIRYIGTSLGMDRSDHYDGRLFTNGWRYSSWLTTRNDYSLSFYREISRFEETNDNVYNLSLSGNVSDRFKQWGATYEWGKRADTQSRYLTFWTTRRVLKKLDIGLSGAVLAHGANSEQYIFTGGWEFDDRRAITARVVYTNGKTNGYLTFRNAGSYGADLYVTLGDPNADRTTNRIAVKWARAM